MNKRLLIWTGLAVFFPLLVSCASSIADSKNITRTVNIDGIPAGDYCRSHFAMHDNSAMVLAEVQKNQSVLEAALALRAVSIDVARYLKLKIDKGKPLSGKELDLINQGTAKHLKLRATLMHIAKAHACWPGMSTDILSEYGLDRDSHMLGVHLSLAAALVLYDNYLLTVSMYEDNQKLRAIINRKDAGYNLDANMLTNVQLSYIEPENREYLRAAISFYEVHRQDTVLLYNEEMTYLKLLIDQSPSYSKVRSKLGLAGLVRDFSLLRQLGLDGMNLLSQEGVNLFSSLFGNTVGLVETRRGKLHRQRDAHQHLSSVLQAGDILLEKTPFRLTDKLIPGHWGHAAVWIGSPDELISLGIGDHELVQRYWNDIGSNKSIVEALRSGVKLSSLKQFMNVDDLVVLRPTALTNKERRHIVIQALRQVGKAYDFNFDVETTDRIVCSELVYLSHDYIEWPTSNSLGRATISPDQISNRSGSGQPLKVAALYLNGRRVEKNLASRLRRLQ